MIIRCFISRYVRAQKGAVAVEAAFILPFLILGGIGVMDASYLLLQNHKMETGLANAGSYLARASNPQTVELQAKRIATFGTTQAAGHAVIHDWMPADVTIGYKVISNGSVSVGTLYRGGNNISVVQISSEKTYAGFGILKAAFGGSLTIKAAHEQRLTGDIS